MLAMVVMMVLMTVVTISVTLTTATSFSSSSVVMRHRYSYVKSSFNVETTRINVKAIVRPISKHYSNFPTYTVTYNSNHNKYDTKTQSYNEYNTR